MNASSIASYLDRRLSGPEREKAEAHLVECETCRADVIATRETMQRLSRPRKFATIAAVGVAAALLVVVPFARRTDQLSTRSRANPVAPDTHLLAYGPLGETESVTPRFVWAATPRTTVYRLTLFAEKGVPLWTYSGPDTSVSLPDSVRLSRGRDYFWLVDAILSDGSARSTGLRQFRRDGGQ